MRISSYERGEMGWEVHDKGCGLLASALAWLAVSPVESKRLRFLGFDFAGEPCMERTRETGLTSPMWTH